MKITKVENWAEHLRLVKPYTIAYETYSDVVNHFVRIETDTGSFGLGVASPEDYVTGENTVDCKKALDNGLESLLIGRDIRHIGSFIKNLKKTMPKTPAALSTSCRCSSGNSASRRFLSSERSRYRK